MAAIRSKNTKPEMLIRRGLHARGFRFRLHNKKLPGTPDIVLRRFHALIDIRGCFFHGHDCNLFRPPIQRRDYWEAKIEENRQRDQNNLVAQKSAGWRVAVIWECSMRGPSRIGIDAVIDTIENWLFSSEASLELQGFERPPKATL
jgi:DNA mismatch endonuclease (patch repair protein)